MKKIRIKVYIGILLLFLTASSKSQILKDEWITCIGQNCKVLDPYYSKGVTMKWEGPCANGKANGYGKLTKYIDGKLESTYVGEYKNGIREGKGTFTHIDGSVAEGNFINGQLMGYGTKTAEDGSKYIGNLVNYREHGYGTETYANGSKFEGFFVSDQRYTGKFTSYNGGITYLQNYYPVDKIKDNNSGYRPVIGTRVTEYFDENWKRCNQKNASYYRLITYQSENKPIGAIKDYYISGSLQSEFTAVYIDYNDDNKNFHEGEATWYYESGQIQQSRYYYNNKINGPNIYYFENGQQSSVVNYYHGVLNGVYKTFYKTGKIHEYKYYDYGKLYENKYIDYDENGSGAIVYDEPFYSNKDDWEFKYDNSSSIINSDYNLSLNVYNQKLTSRQKYISLNQNSDYSIESIIHKKVGKEADGYGIVFGFKDWDNYYQFLISEFGSYRIMGMVEGMSINLTEWKKSDAINLKNQRNLLKIFKYDNQFIFSINSIVVETLESKNLRSNNFGIIAHGKGEYIMENLKIKQFVTSEELEKSMQQEQESNIAGIDGEWKSSGSGFFISSRGYIATNYHVIEDANEIQVQYYQKGQKLVYSAKVVTTDKTNDLAVLKIDDNSFKSLPAIPYVFTISTKDVGTDVFALGYPQLQKQGTEIKFTDGKISAKTGYKGNITEYQISVPIQPGNSGGPLFDSKGNLIGITTAYLVDAQNVNYAIKTSYLKNLVEVMPEKITLPANTEIYSKSLTDKIKVLSDFIPIILVK
jgi:S1-C subfamily serine protease/antitoxin component YwqK of YwqJK toxin-antitoxin module